MVRIFALLLFISSTLPTSSQTEFKVSVEATNYNETQKIKLGKATEALKKIFNSEDFKKSFGTVQRFSENQGLSNLEVFQRLSRGSEKLSPGDDFEMDLIVTMYTKTMTKVVGYTNPKTKIVYTNSKFHDSFNHCQVAANLSHEWAHKVGFSHKSAKDKNSVPYALGDRVLEICNKNSIF